MDIPGKAGRGIGVDRDDRSVGAPGGKARKGRGLLHPVDREEPGPVGKEDGLGRARAGSTDAWPLSSGGGMSPPCASGGEVGREPWIRVRAGDGCGGLFPGLGSFPPQALPLRGSPPGRKHKEQGQPQQEDQRNQERPGQSSHGKDLTCCPGLAWKLRQKRRRIASSKKAGILESHQGMARLPGQI